MFLQGPHKFLLLGIVFGFQDVLGLCERPAWTRVAWDMTPQDLEQLMGEQQSSGFQTSTFQICHLFAGLSLSKECLEIFYSSCKAALFIVAGLSTHYLFRKLIVAKTPKSCQATAVSVTTEQHYEYTNQNMDKMLCRLVANTSRMMKYLKCFAYYQRKEFKCHKLSKKKKGDDTDGDEQLFPICPYNHSSDEDAIMHEI
ncbi:testis-expressed protein 50 [Varanus komodoensis]|uniref:testis-expressed protein 50 n=1 Tax=Varanus komodoensis TaxID=61221 RepID=UPI001CF76E0E|nr:testis-expressed protein 50 [Varanus komodoensis]